MHYSAPQLFQSPEIVSSSPDRSSACPGFGDWLGTVDCQSLKMIIVDCSYSSMAVASKTTTSIPLIYVGVHIPSAILITIFGRVRAHLHSFLVDRSLHIPSGPGHPGHSFEPALAPRSHFGHADRALTGPPSLTARAA